MTRPCSGPGEPTSPSIAVPHGACDTHLHVLGPFDTYPLIEARPYTPPPATLTDLRRYLDVMGLDRVVVAQPSAAGTHMAVTLDAIAELGDQARGTALIKPDVSDDELARLHAGGIRGVRLSASIGFPVTANTIREIAARVAPLAWHIAVWPENAEEIRVLRSSLDRLPVDLVIDHMAARSWRPEGGVKHPDFLAVCDLLDTGRAWLKLSAMCRASDEPAPWRELIPFGAALVDRFSERLLWASDWPHVGLWDGHMPRSGQLLDWLPEIGVDDAIRERILVANPCALYDFPPLAAGHAARQATASDDNSPNLNRPG